MRAVISIEADNADSIRWYVREIHGLREGHPVWLDVERQLRAADKARSSPSPSLTRSAVDVHCDEGAYAVRTRVA